MKIMQDNWNLCLLARCKISCAFAEKWTYLPTSQFIHELSHGGIRSNEDPCFFAVVRLGGGLGIQRQQKRKSFVFFFYSCSLVQTLTKMAFLDISLTKDTTLLLHAICSPFCWQILKKPILFSGFKNPYKKTLETRNKYFHFVEQNKRGQKTRQKLDPEKTPFYSQTPRLKVPFKNSISTQFVTHRKVPVSEDRCQSWGPFLANPPEKNRIERLLIKLDDLFQISDH